MTSVVHDRKNNNPIPLNQDGRSMQVVTQKLDLGQTSKELLSWILSLKCHLESGLPVTVKDVLLLVITYLL